MSFPPSSPPHSAKRGRTRSPTFPSPIHPSQTSTSMAGRSSSPIPSPTSEPPPIRQGRTCKTLTKMGMSRLYRQGSGEDLKSWIGSDGMFDRSKVGSPDGSVMMDEENYQRNMGASSISLPEHDKSAQVELNSMKARSHHEAENVIESEEEPPHRDEMFFYITRGKIPPYESLKRRKSDYVPGEWPLDSRGRLKRTGSRKKRDGSVSKRREKMKEDNEEKEDEDKKVAKELRSTNSTPTRNKRVWHTHTSLIGSETEWPGNNEGSPHWNGGLEYYLMALWGLFVALIVAIISIINEHPPPPTFLHPRPPKRSFSSSPSRRSGGGVSSSTRPPAIRTTTPPNPPNKMLSRHVTFPPVVALLHPPIEKVRSLSISGLPAQSLQPPRIETRRVSEGDQPTSPASSTSVASHMPELTADEGSNTTSPRSASPSSPVDERKRPPLSGLMFSPIHPTKGAKRDSLDGISPMTSPAGSPPPSRRPSVMGPRPDTHFSRTIAGTIGRPRESTESSMTRMESVSVKNEEKQRRPSGTALMLKSKLAAAFQRNPTKKQGEVLSLHQTLEGTPTLSPPSSEMPSRVPSYSEGKVPSSSGPPARSRTNSVFSLLKRRQSEDKSSPPTPPRVLTKSRERRKSTGAYGLNISSPIVPALRPEQIKAMRQSLDSMRERSESAPEVPQRVARTIGGPNARSTTPPISNNPTAKPRKLVRTTTDSTRLRSNPYDNIPDWSTTVPGYERRRRRKEIRELEDNLETLRGWLQGDNASRRDRIKWEKSKEKLVEQLSELRRKGMEGREMKEFEAREEAGVVEIV